MLGSGDQTQKEAAWWCTTGDVLFRFRGTVWHCRLQEILLAGQRHTYPHPAALMFSLRLSRDSEILRGDNIS